MSREPRDETYNGYPNRPTWMVALWLDNERASYKDVQGVVADMLAEGERDADWSQLETSTAYDLAVWLKVYVENQIEPLYEAGMASDLLGWALGLVDWRHLAENYIAKAKREASHE
jgi:hypothetical protein